MRYIRTKDGIYRNASTDDEITIICPRRKPRVNPKGILKQADNIKELFDEIVAVPHNGEKPMLGRIEVPASGGIDYPMFLNQKTGWYHDLYSFVGVYGAIWVIDSNGIPTLKPIAKLNEKGELELI